MVYEWTVKEGVMVRSLARSANLGLFLIQDNSKAVVVRLPRWDSIGTVFFNDEKWFTGYAQSQLREMLRIAGKHSSDVIFANEHQIMKDMNVVFDKAPEAREL